MAEIYLDNAATTKAFPEVATAVQEALTTNYANPSSLHQKGLAAEKIVKKARKKLAQQLKVKADEIYFTSGGTEANNLAIKGTVKSLSNYGNRIITTKIEHPSVLNVYKSLEADWDVKYLDVNQNGKIDLEQLQEYLNNDTILVSIMAVNNELGTIQPLNKISKLTKEYQNLYLHVDGIQALGKIDFFPERLGIDICSVSAHKIHGPKGVGALYAAEDTRLKNIFCGSGQEEGLRPGTENVPGIAGFAKAIDLLASKEEIEQMYQLKETLVNRILTEIEGSTLNGPAIRDGAPHIANISFAGIRGEILVHSLAEDDIYVSTGAACSSRRKDSNHILEAIGIADDLIDKTIRFSLSTTNTEAEIETVITKLKEKITMLRKII
ncbi:cysteine desulfurase family protein [Halanaerobacter jeridensis]|uniref:Cysteine desulfurase n=1 Tax=Halanaerobacter jeridensis TaxID=706427 RepID=A0A938XSI9_9FIRM|nr:cysteine desulfurase family protein [Halanaerobacter jeridensis]MBM7556705.1 cysteine desulfurase [Halanaerobacter jeridensis]